MGNKQTTQLVSDENMKIYLGLTYLDRYEIERYKKLFKNMVSDYKNSTNKQPQHRNASEKVPIEIFFKHVPSLHHNPFRDRIFYIFTKHNGDEFETIEEEGYYDNDDSGSDPGSKRVSNNTNNNNNNNLNTDQIEYSSQPRTTSFSEVLTTMKSVGRDPRNPLTNGPIGYPSMTHKFDNDRLSTTKSRKFSKSTSSKNKLSSNPNENYMRFEDFLDLMSVFSDRCPPQIKAYYAFHIYDFDEDGIISKSDIAEMVKRLTGVDDEKERKERQQELKNKTKSKVAINLEQATTATRRAGVKGMDAYGTVNYDQYEGDDDYYKQNEMNDPLKFIDEISNSILEEAAGKENNIGTDGHKSMGVINGISQVEFQKILLQNPEFKSHFTFKMV